MPKPYVYRCEHKLTKRFYIGYRQANILPAKEDLGIHYFTSCREVRKNFSEYTYEILSEYDSAAMAYEVEQVLLYNLRHDPLLINGSNFGIRNHIALDPKPIHLERCSNSGSSWQKRKSNLQKQKDKLLEKEIKIEKLLQQLKVWREISDTRPIAL